MASYRDQLERRERLAWLKAEAQTERDKENRVEYAKYAATLAVEQERIPEAEKVKPLSFEEWASYLDNDEPDPVTRGLAATNRSLAQKYAEHLAREVQGGKDPDCYVDPATIGPEHAMTEESATKFNSEQAQLFREQNPWWYGCEANKAALVAYLERNDLQIVTAEMLRRAAEKLRELNMLEEPPEPEPKNPALNEYGVNLTLAEPTPEMVREQRRRDYYQKKIFTDRYGQSYTQCELDKMDAETYRNVVLGEFATPKMTDMVSRQPGAVGLPSPRVGR